MTATVVTAGAGEAHGAVHEAEGTDGETTSAETTRAAEVAVAGQHGAARGVGETDGEEAAGAAEENMSTGLRNREANDRSPHLPRSGDLGHRGRGELGECSHDIFIFRWTAARTTPRRAHVSKREHRVQ